MEKESMALEVLTRQRGRHIISLLAKASLIKSEDVDLKAVQRDYPDFVKAEEEKMKKKQEQGDIQKINNSSNSSRTSSNNQQQQQQRTTISI
ncbi:hypothetical protein BGW39_011946 [Mortierella sp. 14UC]|nr:hypothetical protein BGW39_011946 [Mortierella sp. 14UC]